MSNIDKFEVIKVIHPKAILQEEKTAKGKRTWSVYTQEGGLRLARSMAGPEMAAQRALEELGRQWEEYRKRTGSRW